MPIFEYVCRNCHERFETLVRGASVPACPSCRGEDLARQLSVFAVNARAAERPARVGPCGTCGDPRGPGACSLDG